MASRDHAPAIGFALEGLADYLREHGDFLAIEADDYVGGLRNRTLAEAEDCRRWAQAVDALHSSAAQVAGASSRDEQ